MPSHRRQKFSIPSTATMFSPLARSKYLSSASAATTPATASTSAGSTGSLSSCESISSPPARPQKLPIGRAYFDKDPVPFGNDSAGDSAPASPPSSISSTSSSKESPASADDWASGFETQEEDNDEGRDSPPSSDDDGNGLGSMQAKRPAGTIFATPRPSAAAPKRQKRVSFASDQTVRHSNTSSSYPSGIRPSTMAPKLDKLATVASAAREEELHKLATATAAPKADKENARKEESTKISLGSLFGVFGRPLGVCISTRQRISMVNQAKICLPAEDIVDGRTPPALFALKTTETGGVCGEWRFSVGSLPEEINVVIGRDLLEHFGLIGTTSKEE